MIRRKYAGLIGLLITMDGDGCKELSKRVESGKISPEDAVFVELHANIQKTLDMLNGMLDRLEYRENTC